MPNAIRIHAQGGSEVLKYEPIDTPEPGEGEIAIRHGAIGLNYIDVYHRSGVYPIANFPAIIGLEGAGTVFAVGKGVTILKEGDRVAYAAPPMGAYADERIMPAQQVVKLPDNIAFDTAAAMMLQGMTVQYLTRPTLMTYIADPANMQLMARDLMDVVQSGAVKININQRYALADAAKAHDDLEGRNTTGSTIFEP